MASTKEEKSWKIWDTAGVFFKTWTKSQCYTVNAREEMRIKIIMISVYYQNKLTMRDVHVLRFCVEFQLISLQLSEIK